MNRSPSSDIEYTDFVVHVRVKVSVGMRQGVEISTEEISSYLQDVFNQYTNGRYGFCVEQTSHGMSACVEKAVRNAVSDRTYARYRSAFMLRACAGSFLTNRKLEGLHVYTSEEMQIIDVRSV